MKGFAVHLGNSLRLHFRNRMALLYGYLFPLIFLGAFWVLYRYEKVPLLLHFGELLTVGVLGGACFGLPTTLVSERERGVWRRLRLAPVGTWALIVSTLLARYLLVLTAALLQFGVALAVGMTKPEHPAELALVFTLVAFAFIGLGLVIAMLADTVPAVQALGQCLFLPMLIVGGVAVPLAGLPVWAQHLSAFFPGRYAVEALQACVSGGDLKAIRFDLCALGLIGAAGCLAGAKLFRWESGQRFSTVRGKLWLVPALAAWIAVGIGAETRGRVEVHEVVVEPPVVPHQQPWELLTEQDIDRIDFNVPSDNGLVTPIAPPDESPNEGSDLMLAKLEGQLPHWGPGHVRDPVQRVLNLLCVAGVPDLVQNRIERYIPALVLQRLQAMYPPEKLVKLLAWIVLHPDDRKIISDVSELGLEGVGSPQLVRERVHIYAIKFLARVSGRKTIQQ
jgi:hypothetical protein